MLRQRLDGDGVARGDRPRRAMTTAHEVTGRRRVNSSLQVPFDRVHNASVEVQRSVGSGTVVTLGYVGNWGYNQSLTADINPIPLGTRAPFNQANADPTNGNGSLPDIMLRTFTRGSMASPAICSSGTPTTIRCRPPCSAGSRTACHGAPLYLVASNGHDLV